MMLVCRATIEAQVGGRNVQKTRLRTVLKKYLSSYEFGDKNIFM